MNNHTHIYTQGDRVHLPLSRSLSLSLMCEAHKKRPPPIKKEPPRKEPTTRRYIRY